MRVKGLLPDVGPYFRRVYEKYYPYEIFVFAYVLVMSLGLMFAIADGLFVTDEAVYFLMVKSVAENRPLEIWNGLDEIDHPALRFTSLAVVSMGRLYAQYPPLYAFIAYPFYVAFGFHGLFLLNLFAFSASMLLLYLIVRRVFGDRLLGAAGVVAFSLFTYSLGFSIELWPHMLSVAMVLASFYLTIGSEKRSLGFIVAGFVSASAVGVRYQNVVFSFILFFYILFECGLARSGVFLAGLSLPLALVLSINYLIFGGVTVGYSALDYPSYWHFALLSTLFFVLWSAYPRLRVKFSRMRIFMFFLVIVLSMLVLLQIADSNWAGKFEKSLKVVYAEVVDMWSFPLVDYFRRMSLLQAAPFLVLAFFGVIKALGEDKRPVFLFVVFSLAEIVFFSSIVGIYGSGTFTMRYFLESVPFLAALSLYASFDSLKRVRPYCVWIYGAVFFLMLFAFIAVNGGSSLFAFYRALPLVLVVYLLVLHPLRRVSRPMEALYVSFLVVALSYSFYISIFELAVSRVSREFMGEVYAGLCRVMSGDSLIVYNTYTDIVKLAPVRLCASPRFALVRLNETGKAGGLVEFYLKRGVPVYVIDEGQEQGWGSFEGELKLKYNHTNVVESNVTLTRLNPTHGV